MCINEKDDLKYTCPEGERGIVLGQPNGRLCCNCNVQSAPQFGAPGGQK
jgi:hypothetical protein